MSFVVKCPDCPTLKDYVPKNGDVLKAKDTVRLRCPNCKDRKMFIVQPVLKVVPTTKEEKEDLIRNTVHVTSIRPTVPKTVPKKKYEYDTEGVHIEGDVFRAFKKECKVRGYKLGAKATEIIKRWVDRKKSWPTGKEGS